MTSEYCDKSDEEDEGCQSNCEQPGSGSSGGDVQKRVIGYYEAWNYKKKCIGMSMDDIPVNSLSHIYYSFAYIKPDTYDIIPMEDDKDGTLTADTFTEFTALKRKNPSLKAVVALISARIPESAGRSRGCLGPVQPMTTGLPSGA